MKHLKFDHTQLLALPIAAVMVASVSLAALFAPVAHHIAGGA